MNESKISVRYSKALFESAREKDLVERVRSDMRFILELSSHPEVKEMLASPIIENSVKKAALVALIDGNIDAISAALVKLAVENNRESFLPGIARCYIDLADRYNGITKATLTSAAGLSEELLGQIKGMIDRGLDTKTDLEEKVDPDITGGFILKIEDRYIDASVRSQLRKIGKEMAQ